LLLLLLLLLELFKVPLALGGNVVLDVAPRALAAAIESCSQEQA